MTTRATAIGMLAATALATVVSGCAALPLAAVAGPLLDVGGGALVKTGTEYTASGTARRTFRLPSEQVHTAVLETFRRAEIPVAQDTAARDGQRIVANAHGRSVHVRLVSLTPVLTSLELDVKRNLLASDKATASELLAETEQVLGEGTPLAVQKDAPPPARSARVARSTR
jgi:hypothetical protein